MYFEESKEKLKFENDRNFSTCNADNMHEDSNNTKSLHNVNDILKRKSIGDKKQSFNQNSSSKN